MVHDPDGIALAGVSSSGDSRNLEYFALGSVVMLGIVGLVLLVVSRRIKRASSAPPTGAPVAT